MHRYIVKTGECQQNEVDPWKDHVSTKQRCNSPEKSRYLPKKLFFNIGTWPDCWVELGSGERI